MTDGYKLWVNRSFVNIFLKILKPYSSIGMKYTRINEAVWTLWRRCISKVAFICVYQRMI